MKLGLAAYRADERDLQYATYRSPATLPPRPRAFIAAPRIAAHDWGMLGNDEYGDCAWAAADHLMMALDSDSAIRSSFTTQTALADYAAATGFDTAAGAPGENPTDRGTDMRVLLNYLRARGVTDTTGKRHRAAAYVQLDAQNLEHVYEACYLFQALLVGVSLPSSAETQFAEGRLWVPRPDDEIVGGHAILLVGVQDHLPFVTWGRVQQATVAWWRAYVEQVYAIISPDDFDQSGESPAGFDYDQLFADLEAVSA